MNTIQFVKNNQEEAKTLTLKIEQLPNDQTINKCKNKFKVIGYIKMPEEIKIQKLKYIKKIKVSPNKN